MLAPRQILFTAVDDVLHPTSGSSWEAATQALEALVRRGVPLIVASRGTRAQLEPLRRKIEHGHPFLTESGAGLFIPDSTPEADALKRAIAIFAGEVEL